MSKEMSLYFVMREAPELVDTCDGTQEHSVTRICCAPPMTVLHPAATWRTVEESEVLVLGVHSAAYLAAMLPWFTDSPEVAAGYIKVLEARAGAKQLPHRFTVEEIHYTAGALGVSAGALRQACMAADENMKQNAGGF
jgi:hypothetical protein